MVVNDGGHSLNYDRGARQYMCGPMLCGVRVGHVLVTNGHVLVTNRR